MDKNTKILIVVIIVLVAVLGVVSGFLLQNLLNVAPVVNNTTVNVSNSTNSSVSNQTNSSNQAQSNGTSDNYISASQALSIAKSAMPGYDQYLMTAFPPEDGPHYVFVCIKDPKPRMAVWIDAYTGEVIDIR